MICVIWFVSEKKIGTQQTFECFQQLQWILLFENSNNS
jgi:hypothetical protein